MIDDPSPHHTEATARIALTSDAASATASAAPASLLRVMSTFGLAAGIINITIGGGVFRLPADVAASLGAVAPVAYLICAAAMGLIVACMADAGRRVPLTGGPYAYISVALGPYAGFLSGILLLMTGLFGGAAVASVFASSIGGLVPLLAGRWGQVLVVLGTLALWSRVNMRGVALATRLNVVTTVAKLIPLLLIAIGGLFFVQPAHFHVADWPDTGDVARTSLLLIFAFGGIEAALVPCGEVREPARTVPRAIALAMIGVVVLYVALQVSAQGILGDRLAHANVSPLADVADTAFGGWARAFLLMGAAVSIFGVLGGLTLAVPRLLFALARDGYLPRVLGTIHPEHRTPQVAILTYSGLLLVLATSGTFEELAILTNLAGLALYFGCALAAWQLRAGAAMTLRERLRLGGLVPWWASGVIAWLFMGATRAEWLAFGGALAIATLVYGLTRARQSTAATQHASPI
jgi:amino acid transporter